MKLHDHGREFFRTLNRVSVMVLFSNDVPRSSLSI